MNDQVKSQLSGESYGTAGPWYPLRKWWEPSRRFNQDAGLLPVLESVAPQRMDWLQRSLATCYWPGYSPTPLFVPYICKSLHHPSAGLEQYKWRVSLDVSHFSASEISLIIKDGFLQIGGRHEERPDEHGFIARCFTRKYRLPAEIDAAKIVSSLSVDGILTVEAPVPEPSVPATIIIPIKVEMESAGEQHETETPTDVETENGTAPEVQDIPSAEEDQAELHGDSSTTGVQQDEEKKEEEEEKEETTEKAAEDSHPAESGDPEALESQQIQKEEDEETQVKKAVEQEITQPEEQDVSKSPASEGFGQETE